MTAAAVLITTASIQLAPNDTYTNPGVDYDTNFVVAHAGGALEEDGDELNYLNFSEDILYNSAFCEIISKRDNTRTIPISLVKEEIEKYKSRTRKKN